jgi:hypothetical protein
MPLLPENSSFNDFGGSKVDYSAVVDSSTDRSSTQVNAAFCASAMMTRTAPRVWFDFIAGVNPSITQWEAVWKGATSTPPVITYYGTGLYGIAFPSTISDELGGTHSVSFKYAMASVIGNATNFAFTTITTNTILIYTYASLVTNDLTGLTVTVMAV